MLNVNLGITLISFADLQANPGAVETKDFMSWTPGEMFLTGRHGGAYVSGKWLAVSPTTIVKVEDFSVRIDGTRNVLGVLRLVSDGRLIDLASVYAARE